MATDISKTKGELTGFQELTEWGKFAVQSGVLPAGITAMQAMAIIQTGKELGIGPMQSLRSMQFVNGRLTLSTQLMLALARRDYGIVVEEMRDEPNQCTVTLRRGEERITTVYTMEMATKAKLTAKPAWSNHPEQMLRYRALSSNLKIIAPDSSLNLATMEEAEDLEPLRVPAGLDPEKSVPITENSETITKGQRIEIIQAMTKNKWIVDGAMTAGAVEKLGSLGYENSQQIPKAEYESVLKAFSEPAPAEAKQPELAV